MLVIGGRGVSVRALPARVVCGRVPPGVFPPPLLLRPRVGVGPPLALVVLKTMPLTGSGAAVLLPEEMLWKLRPLAPIVVFVTLSAVALTELIELPLPCTLIVPPPVALKPTPVVVLITSPPPVKLTV